VCSSSSSSFLKLSCCFRYEGAKKSPTNDGLFDDDDMLGSMGLESPKPAGRKSTLLLPDSPPEGGARSVLDDLLQGSKKTSKSEKPADFMSSSLKVPGIFSTSCLIVLLW